MYAFVSVGQCGGGILDSFFSEKTVRDMCIPLAINSATSDLINLKNIPRDRWLGVSKNGFMGGDEKDFDSIVAGGYGQNRDRAERDSLKHYPQLLEKLSDYFLEGDVDTKTISCAFVVLSLGGGTGSGVGPVVASAFRALGIPVMAIAVMPATEEGSLAASNAYVSLKRLTGHTNTTILVDNQRIAYTGNMANAYMRYNDYIAKALSELILGSSTDRIDPNEFSGNPPVIDINDIITSTTVKGKTTYACLARSSEKARDLLHYLFPIIGWKKIDVIKLLYESFLKLSVEGIKPEECEKNLTMLRLPPHYLLSEGMLAPIDIIRSFLSERSHMKQTHLGVSLTKKNLVSTVLLFTYLEENVARVSQLRSQAAHYKQERPGRMVVGEMFLVKVDTVGSDGATERAEVVIGDLTKPSGSVFALEKGSHQMKIKSKNHEVYKGRLNAEEHSAVSVTLVPKGSEKTLLEIMVKSRGNKIKDAEIHVADETVRTDSDGYAEIMLERGSHQMTVVHPDYKVYEKELDCSDKSLKMNVNLLKKSRQTK